MMAQESLEAQREADAATPRAWLAQAAEEGREEARRAACEEFAAEAAERGYCMSCWARSTRWGLYLDKPRKVRHRRPGSCPGVRRRKLPPG
jgi:hypothetical protein